MGGLTAAAQLAAPRSSSSADAEVPVLIEPCSQDRAHKTVLTRPCSQDRAHRAAPHRRGGRDMRYQTLCWLASSSLTRAATGGVAGPEARNMMVTRKIGRAHV